MSGVSSSTSWCRRCGADIRWCTTADGERIPVTAHHTEFITDQGRVVRFHQRHRCGQPE